MPPCFRSFPALLLAALLAAPLAGCERKPETSIRSSVRDHQVNPPVENPPAQLLSSQEAFIQVSVNVTPAVVNIRAARMRSMGELGPMFEEFFGPFFRGRPMPQQKEQSLGSGLIISEDGFILTNEHVIRDAEEIKVRLSNQRVYDGQVIGVDPRTDIAVLKIDAGEKLPAAVLGNSDNLQVGQWALAIGNPFGLDRTLTVGVISAIGRSEVGIEDLEDFIQTDASINPGNSGGPLLNIYGEVVGINTAIVATGQGIGFAIPINLARLVADQLMEKGEITRSWLGVSIQPLTPELAESFGLEQIAGALVNQVLPNSPAANAGLQRGDILLAYNGKQIHGARELQLMVASTPAGKKVALEVLRGGKRLTVPVTIAEMQPQEKVADGSPAAPGKGEGLGLTVEPAEGEGVMVAAVDPRSPAAAAGVQPGDIILSINRHDVNDLASYQQAVKKAQGGRNIVLLLRRGENTLYLAFPVS